MNRALRPFLKRIRDGGMTIAATVLAAAGQWALIAITGRLAGVEQLGLLSWAMAFVSPWLILASLQLRTVIAGHEPDIILFKSLMHLRVLCLLATTTVLLIVAWFCAPRACLPTVVGVLVWGLATWIGDLLQGWMQVRGRIGMAAVCLATRSAGAAALTAAVLSWYPAGGAMVTAIIAALVSIIVVLAIEMPVVQRLEQVHAPSTTNRSLVGWFLFTMPLGIATGVGSLSAVLPRFALMHWQGPVDLGVFTSMTVLVTAACQLFGAPAPLLIARLAGLLNAGDGAGARRLLQGLVAIALVFGLGGYLGAISCGPWVMRLIFGTAIGSDVAALPDMALVAVVELLQFPLGYLLTAGHCYRQQILPTMAGFLATASLVYLWVPTHGMAGAAWALMGGGGVRLALMVPTGVRLLRGVPHAD